MRPLRSLGVCFATLLFFAASGRAGTLHGTVKNGTTGKSAPDVEVILIQLQGGMQPVANSKTDAQGQFSFDYPALGSQPMLVRAIYKGINFHQPAPPGNSTLEVSVFEPSKDPKIISVASRIVFFQPSGDHLTVAEEYSVQNHSQPPQAYFRADGNFEFVIPENAHLQQVAASGPTGMPVTQTPIDKGKGKYAIAYALRPGQNTMRYAYEVPYPGNTATVKVATIYPAERLLVAAAPTIQSIPGRLDVLKWPLIAGFVGIFALGAMLLARKPVMAVAGDAPASGGKAKAVSKSKRLSDVDAAVDTNLDALKDQLFRLELRRQAGTISEEEYAQERARAEKVLRELVRG